MWMSAEHSDQKEIDYSHLQSFTDLIIGCNYFFLLFFLVRVVKKKTQQKKR